MLSGCPVSLSIGFSICDSAIKIRKTTQTTAPHPTINKLHPNDSEKGAPLAPVGLPVELSALHDGKNKGQNKKPCKGL